MEVYEGSAPWALVRGGRNQIYIWGDNLLTPCANEELQATFHKLMEKTMFLEGYHLVVKATPEPDKAVASALDAMAGQLTGDIYCNYLHLPYNHPSDPIFDQRVITDLRPYRRFTYGEAMKAMGWRNIVIVPKVFIYGPLRDNYHFHLYRHQDSTTPLGEISFNEGELNSYVNMRPDLYWKILAIISPVVKVVNPRYKELKLDLPEGTPVYKIEVKHYKEYLDMAELYHSDNDTKIRVYYGSSNEPVKKLHPTRQAIDNYLNGTDEVFGQYYSHEYPDIDGYTGPVMTAYHELTGHEYINFYPRSLKSLNQTIHVLSRDGYREVQHYMPHYSQVFTEYFRQHPLSKEEKDFLYLYHRVSSYRSSTFHKYIVPEVWLLPRYFLGLYPMDFNRMVAMMHLKSMQREECIRYYHPDFSCEYRNDYTQCSSYWRLYIGMLDAVIDDWVESHINRRERVDPQVYLNLCNSIIVVNPRR